MAQIRRSLCSCHVGLAKTVTLEQERFAHRLRQRIGKAIAKVQARLVASLPEVEKGLAGKLTVLDRHRLNHEVRATKERLRLAHAFRAKLAFDHDRQLDLIRNTDTAYLRVVDEPYELIRFGFAVKNGHHRRGIEDHLGSPFSS